MRHHRRDLGETTPHPSQRARRQHLCGRIAWLGRPLDENGQERRDGLNPDPALRDRPVLGLQILRDVGAVPDRKGAYRGGRIYDPESGKTYRCTLRLDDDGRLRFRGYVGISLFGRTTIWTRAGADGDTD